MCLFKTKQNTIKLLHLKKNKQTFLLQLLSSVAMFVFKLCWDFFWMFSVWHCLIYLFFAFLLKNFFCVVRLCLPFGSLPSIMSSVTQCMLCCLWCAHVLLFITEHPHNESSFRKDTAIYSGESTLTSGEHHVLTPPYLTWLTILLTSLVGSHCI